MQKIDENREIKFFYINIILFNIAKSMPQPILTIILLDKGLTIFQSIFIQFFFTLSNVIFEIPSGYLSDKYGRKKVALLSYALIILAYMGVWYFEKPYCLYGVWFIYGLSLAMYSGTIETEFNLRYKDNEEKLQKVITSSKYYYFISCLIGAITGALLYEKIGINIYLLSFIFFIISFILVNAINFKNDNEATSSYNTKYVFNKIKILLKVKYNQINFIKYIFSRSLIIPLYILWQPILIEQNINNPRIFSLIYIIIMVIGIISSKLFHKVSIKIQTISRITLLLTVIYYFSITTPVLLMPIFFLIMFLAYINMIYCEIQLKKSLDNDVASTVISVCGTFIAIINIIITACASVMNKHGVTAKVELFIFLLTLVSIIILIDLIGNLHSSS